MVTQTKTVIDLADGAVSEVPMTAEDLLAQNDLAVFEAATAADKVKADATRAALLKRLGLTADELVTLLG